MIEFFFDLITSLIPELLDGWLQSKLDKIRNKHLRRFLRVITWLLCALLELAIAVSIIAGLIWLVPKLGHWILDLIGIE